MIPAIFPRSFLLAALLASTPLFAGFREDIGFVDLQASVGSLPNGSSLKIAHIEYVRDGKWAPEAVDELAGKSITYSPSAPSGYSYHGDEVGRVFYGSSSSVIPGVSQIRAFEAWNYFDFSLNTAKGIAPAVADWDLENHSYISNSGLTTNEGARRMDFRIDRDGVTATVVLENGTGVVPPLFGNTYNTIVVGSSTGSHSRGGTTREVTGRLKPDIVGTANFTSYAGPIVGSAAGLLIAKTKADSSLAMAKRPEVIKAVLMAGATKDEFPTWSRSSTAPIDPIYGAGEVNVNNSYGILVAGRQQASPSAIRSSRGWDLNSVGTGASLHYYFTIGSGQTGTVSAVLTWHRSVSPINGAWSQGVTTSVDNLDLRLYRANSQFQKGDLLQDSVSAIDNVEHVFLRDLSEGTYALVVSSVSGSKQFGLAWNVSGVTSQPPTVTAPAITTQPVAKTVSEGASASFSVAASGTSPFTYQWRKDGAAISGATGSAFSITSATLANAGTYTVVVSNSAGSATSNGAYLTVNSAVSAPAITTQPVAKTVSEGSSASFSVAASGTSPFTYQWRKDGAAISGATGSTFSITSATLDNAGTYTVVISNSAGSATSNGAYLTVNSAVSAPSITAQPSPASAVEGGNATFSVSVSGTSPFTYQWRKDGTAVSGATGSSFSISGAKLADAGTYTVVVSNNAGSTTSNGAYLTVSSSMSAPAITTQPKPKSVNEGASVSFSVVASGTSPFTYQWQRNSVAIAGANESSFSIQSVVLADGGSYSVVVTNGAGSVTSSAAFLTVKAGATAPSITTHPVPASAIEGGSATFNVSASGTSPFTYQWRKDGVAISGATESSLSLNSLTLGQSGTYSVVVSNSAGSATSNGAGLTVGASVAAPAITTQPAAISVIEGSSASFSVSVSGTSPFTYQWRKDGGAISGATGSSFSITSATLANAGTYTVVVSNSAGSATSNGAYLTINSSVVAPTITSQPSPKAVAEGAAVSFSVVASGTSPFTYEWQRNSVAIPGANQSSFSIPSVTLADGGSYSVVVSNGAGSATSSAAFLTVNAAAIAPSITSQPSPAAATVGGSATFSVSTSGTSPFTYQWRKDGAAISGATGSSFSITSATLAHAGTYTVVVSNSAGSATSNGAYLTINSSAVAPTITTQPWPKSVNEGATVSFSVVVSGTSPFTYQWRRNSVAIPGANESSFSIPSVTLAEGGSYSVVITNSAGSASSSAAYLTVNATTVAPSEAPTITNQPVPAIVPVGSSAKFAVSAKGSGSLSYQWRKNGVAISGAVAPTLSISSAQTSDAANYSVLVANSAGSVVSSGAALTVQSTASGPKGGKLGNISSRAKIEAGSGILISGFVVSGDQPKTLMVRAVGPTLSNYDLSGVLNRPMIRIYSGSNLVEEIPSGGRIPSAEVARESGILAGAFSLPENSLDCVIVRSFAPGAYTVHVFGEDGGKGIAIVEVYDLDASSSGSRVVNLSTRSHVGRNNEILIPGLSITGTSPKQVLIRAVGPGLLDYDVEGVLERPKIALYQGSTLVTENTGWMTSPNASEIAAVTSRVGAFQLSESSADSALLVTLAPGGYTLHITGADGKTGVVLAEVFEVSSN